MQGDLSALIERVEKATGPDRGLSCAIGSFFGWQFEHKDGAWNKRPDVVFTLGLPDYTASLDAALELVEQQMAIEWPQYEVNARMIRSGDEWFHYWEITVPSREFQGRSKTPALALLQCLLRALQSQQENSEVKDAG